MRESLDEQLIGKRFGRLVVLHRGGKTRKHFVCQCDCGNKCEVSSDNLKNGSTSSCGCYHKERQPYCHRTHGYSGEKLYKIWKGMRRRCESHSHKNYDRYGGRGIKVCEEWDKNYLVFREWALSNGYDENAKSSENTIDRIDNDGDYCPENCRIVPMKTQTRNTSRNILVTYNGKTQTITDWAAEVGIKYSTLRNRIANGWDTAAALVAKPYCGNNKNNYRTN